MCDSTGSLVPQTRRFPQPIVGQSGTRVRQGLKNKDFFRILISPKGEIFLKKGEPFWNFAHEERLDASGLKHAVAEAERPLYHAETAGYLMNKAYSMLDYLRKSSGSWVAKILFIVLILSFGVWGVGDVIQSKVERTPAVRVGDVEFQIPFVRTQLERAARIYAFNNSNFNFEEAKPWLINETIGRIVKGATIDMAVKESKVVVSDEAIRAYINEESMFQGQDKRFDRDMFQRFLQNNAMTEPQFIAGLRSDLVRERYVTAVSENGFAPMVLSEMLYGYRSERRNGEVFSISSSTVTPDSSADEATLKQLYEERIEQFTAPAQRSLSAIVLTIEDLEKQVVSDDAALAAYYKEHHDLFTVPELRSVSQVIAETEEQAQNLVGKVRGGLDLLSATQEMGFPPPVDLGKVAITGLPGEASDIVFSLAEGDVSDPIPTQFGWHVFLVQGIEEGGERSFDEVKDDIQAAVLREKASERMVQAASEIEDALAADTPLDQVAQTYGVQVLNAMDVTIDSAPQEFPEKDRVAIVRVGFTLQEGDVSRLEYSGDSSFVVRADKVTAPTPRDFELVKAEVNALWLSRARQEKAEVLARQMVEQTSAGQTLAVIGASTKGESSSAVAVDRYGRPEDSGQNMSVSVSVAQALFDLKEGETTWVPTPDGVVVLRLTKIIPADPVTHPEDVQALSRRLAANIGEDLRDLTFQAYAQRYKTMVNHDLINRAM